MRDLRERDAWDAAQTHASLRPYLNEEAHELDDAIREGNDAAIRSELGDVLLQVLFHALIAEQRGAFDIHDVAGSLVHKMRTRHPRLFGDEAASTNTAHEAWEQMKARSRTTLAEGLPAGLPSLHRAHRLQERAAGVGFDWPDAAGPAAKVREELAEAEAVFAPGTAFGTHGVPSAHPTHDELEAELGDLLFAVVNLCRKCDVHPALALDRANAKFQRRFELMEKLAAERAIDMRSAGLAALDRLWDEAKTHQTDE
jgi:MazG family protein